jgi:hypothetical protein
LKILVITHLAAAAAVVRSLRPQDARGLTAQEYAMVLVVVLLVDCVVIMEFLAQPVVQMVTAQIIL